MQVIDLRQIHSRALDLIFKEEARTPLWREGFYSGGLSPVD